MLLVRATENSVGQTESHTEMYGRCGVWSSFYIRTYQSRSDLEWSTKEGDSPVKVGVRIVEVT